MFETFADNFRLTLDTLSNKNPFLISMQKEHSGTIMM